MKELVGNYSVPFTTSMHPYYLTLCGTSLTRNRALKRQDVTGHVDVDGENKSADLGKIVNLMQ